MQLKKKVLQSIYLNYKYQADYYSLIGQQDSIRTKNHDNPITSLQCMKNPPSHLIDIYIYHYCKNLKSVWTENSYWETAQ